MRAKFAIGDRVVYTRDKYSNRPGPRAKNVSPTPHGETYTYQVDKYWIVTSITSDGALVLQTRRGKSHTVPMTDPRLRRANWWERLFYSGRFPGSNAYSSSSGPSSSAASAAVEHVANAQKPV